MTDVNVFIMNNTVENLWRTWKELYEKWYEMESDLVARDKKISRLEHQILNPALESQVEELTRQIEYLQKENAKLIAELEK